MSVPLPGAPDSDVLHSGLAVSAHLAHPSAIGSAIIGVMSACAINQAVYVPVLEISQGVIHE